MTRKEKEEARLRELVANEEPIWQEGKLYIAGADEVGRGPLAGPVVAACVVMPPEPLLAGVYDSKKISAGRRQKIGKEIMQTAVAIGIGVVSSAEIDSTGIAEATRAAFRLSIAEVVRQLQRQPDVLFLDSVKIGADCPVRSMVKADQQVYSVAAASIAAKVYRDRLMEEYAKLYPKFGFAQNKGYGTKAHRAALIESGPAPIHRRSFLNNLERWKEELA